MKFFESGLGPIVKSLVSHDNPLYVQYYVTARCNLRCQQCNVIYANADQQEIDLDLISQMAHNLRKIETSVVLLTGGEPFIRNDLPEIAEIFIENKIHPRLQTNGLATNLQLDRMVEIGAHDISISLDSLIAPIQDEINGGFKDSWFSAIDRISYINNNFPKDSFCALGCVLSPFNFMQIPQIIKFATEIGWWISLVPAHQTDSLHPRSFSTFDPKLVFDPQDYKKVEDIINQAKELRNQGYNLYDSDQYLDDILRFIRKEPITWRDRNGGSCDSPNLYFAIPPNGEFAVCCDYRLESSIKVYCEEFPKQYLNKTFFGEVEKITKSCSGCMYGSFPEITISSRYFKAMAHRANLFLNPKQREIKKMTTDNLVQMAHKLSSSYT